MFETYMRVAGVSHPGAAAQLPDVNRITIAVH